MPVDAAPWFPISCDNRMLSCEFAAEAAPMEPFAAEVTVDGCSDTEPGEDNTPTQGIAHVKPAKLLTAGEGYNVSCDNGLGNGDDGLFYVRDNNIPSMAPLTLESVVARREIDEGCCGTRHLSIKFEYGGGTLTDFMQEGGIVEIEYADGRLFTDETYNSGDDYKEFPDTEDDIIITVVAADGTRSDPMTISSDEFERDLAYIPCSVGAGYRGGLLLWLLFPLLWLRRSNARRRAES